MTIESNPAAKTGKQFSFIRDGRKVTFPKRIDEKRRAALVAGRSFKHHNATLRHDAGAFVMSGPSGRHVLQAVATDAARLDAHWQIFATDSRNARQEGSR